MGFTFKSNIASTNFLSMASGFSGPLDFKSYADFNTQEYIKNGLSVGLDSLITSQRPAPSYALTTDMLDSFEKVDANTPIRSYIYDHKTFGIYPDWADRINRMLDVRSDQAWIGSVAADNVIYCIYSLDAGNASVSSNDFTILSGDGSAESPMYFKHLPNGTPKLANITRSNGCLSCVVQVCLKGETLLVPYKDQTACANETISTALNASSDGTIFIKVAGSSRKTPAAGKITPLLMLRESANNYLAIAAQVDNALSLRYFINGVEAAFFKSNKLFITRENVNKIAVSWSNGVITLSINGETEFIASLSMGTAFKPIDATILSPITNWVSDVANMSIFELAVYDRRLVTTEISKITT